MLVNTEVLNYVLIFYSLIPIKLDFTCFMMPLGLAYYSYQMYININLYRIRINTSESIYINLFTNIFDEIKYKTP